MCPEPVAASAGRGVVAGAFQLDTNGDEPLASKVASVIHSDIVSGRLRPGDRLVQDEIATRLSVSRTPIREAIRHLEALGLVVTRRNVGAVVRPLDPRHIRDTWVVRAELEALATRLATPTVTPTKLEELHGYQERYRTAVVELEATDSSDHLGDIFDEWNAANEAFHGTLLSLADNEQLTGTLDRLQAGYPRRLGWWSVTSSERSGRCRVHEHDVILEHLAAGDSGLAAEAMRRHILDTGIEFVRWLSVPGMRF